MDYISVKDAALKFKISERRVQKLCEEGRIEGAKMLSNIWLIPQNAKKPLDKRTSITSIEDYVTLKDFCKAISISQATAKNWIKLGKLTPSKTINGIPFFSSEYVNTFKSDIVNGANLSLKSRRNKKYVSGNGIYKSYISPQSTNNHSVQLVIDSIIDSSELTDEIIRLHIAECALQLICQRHALYTSLTTSFLLNYLEGIIILNDYKDIIDPLIISPKNALEYVYAHKTSFNISYSYEPNEDVLGLIYISLKNISSRKALGAYYTPTHVVKKLISTLHLADINCTIMDPCCGTGNFLLQLPSDFEYTNIFGNDIDETSILITRINIALKYNTTDITFLTTNFTVSNFLTSNFASYDYIIGNPPWGYDFSDKEKEYLYKKYNSAIGKNIESYDMFIEKSSRCLTDSGIMAFVLPEAILNVKTHAPIRAHILENSLIRSIEFLGNAFDKVQCPCIILQTQANATPFSTLGMLIKTGTSSFIINTERKISADYFSFTTTDDEYLVLQKLLECENSTTLKGNADFALGIVTGGNKDYITHKKTDSNEMILKGADIYKFKFQETDNYISFLPETFQQVAPTHYYRAEEKLLYRFISNQLVFAYDNKQTLSLNSCNILIPHIPGLDIKYIAAILNSRISQYIFNKKYNSIKVLRSHIEELPIPIVDETLQQRCINLVDQFISETSSSELYSIYDELDILVAEIFQISPNEYRLIVNALQGQNLFLY